VGFLVGVFVSVFTYANKIYFPTSVYRVLGALLVLLYLPKIILSAIFLLEDVFNVLRAGSVWAWKSAVNPQSDVVTWAGRRQFISQFAFGLAAIPFAGILYGVTKGKYDFTTHRITLKFKDLPDAFNGMKVVQISDVHVGSFDDKASVQRGIDLINAQKPDLFLFTGDLVNNKAEEMKEWADVFSQIKAPLGQFSILGNHDYGDYVEWDSPEAKQANMEALYKVHEDIGFSLLRNEHALIEKYGAKLQLVGVENWSLGPGPFPRFGDLDKATAGLDANGFTILMSHDPSHWLAKVVEHPHPFHITLSGHTHGMQFGIEIPGFRWSPVKFRYPQWAGLYNHEANTDTHKQHLYVNRGFGWLGFPGRVGIWPEITVLTLEKT
jgi:predicted MPP superfamily phosphohydrolase